MADAALSTLGGEQLRQAALVFVLLWLRMAPMTFAVPLWALPSRPVVASTALSLAVTLCLWPAAMLAAPTAPVAAAPTAVPALAAREVLIGTVLALAMAGPLLALRWAGALADRLLDPDDGQAPSAASSPTSSSSPLSSLYLWCGLLLMLSTGGHHIAIETMGRHVIDTPVGAQPAIASLQPALLGSARVLGDALALCVSLAGPVLIAAVFLELSFGVLARLSPAPMGGLSALPVRRLALIGIVILGAPMLLGQLPPLIMGALERASTIL